MLSKALRKMDSASIIRNIVDDMMPKYCTGTILVTFFDGLSRQRIYITKKHNHFLIEQNFEDREELGFSFCIEGTDNLSLNALNTNLYFLITDDFVNKGIRGDIVYITFICDELWFNFELNRPSQVKCSETINTAISQFTFILSTLYKQ